MKRSRIILGMAALGVVAFGAFAFTSKSTSTQGWYIPNAGGCQQFDQPVDCEIGDAEDCSESAVPALNKQLYSDSTCNTPLSREQGF
ncbi:MAG: hypothetical protein KF704_02045 [Crocinitomicaceae bacterium]|nr:hypothetical protein [Crocinitomicaceae bacterium]